MNLRNSARIVGVLFIIGTVAGILSVFSTGPLRGPDYLINVSANETQIRTGAFLVLIMGLVALTYIVFRLLEFVTYIGSILSILLQLTLSQVYVQAAALDTSIFLAFGTLLQGAEVWIDHIRIIIFSLSALILNYVLYKSKLIPRWLSGMGLIGGTLHLAGGLLGMFDLLTGMSGTVVFLAFNVIIMVQEMVYAVWLIIKGFTSTAIASLNAKTDTESGVF
jgi:hypothetical protein